MRTMTAACAALVFSAAADAATLKLGMGMTGGTNNYTIEDDTNAAILPVSPRTQASPGFSIFQAYIGSEALSQVAGGMMSPGDGVALGIEAGVGLPMGSYEYSLTNGYKPPVGSVNPFAGDTLTVKLTSVPVLVKALYMMPMGQINGALGLSAGPTLIGYQSEMLDTLWDDPARTPLRYRSDKGGATWVESGRNISYRAGTVVVFTIKATLGASFAMSDEDAIGLELPLAYNTTTIVSDNVNRTTGNAGETTYKAALSGIVNPQTDTLSVGGLGFGLNLVWTRRFGGAAPAKKK